MVVKNEKPTISVLLPVYNADKFLSGAIESILSQTFRDFEVFIFDDGSTDESLKLIQHFAKRDSRIRYFSGPNRGLLSILQRGTAETRGEFIARMDADDIAELDRFERQLEFLKTNPECVAVGTRIMRIDPDGEPLGLASVSCDHDSIVKELFNNLPGKICHPTVMMRTKAVLDSGGYQEKYHLEDVDLFLRLAEVGKLANLDQPLLRYRLHASSICHTRKQEHIDLIYSQIVARARQRRGEATDSVYSEVLERPQCIESRAVDVALENACHWSSLALDGGYRRTAWKHAIRAVKIHPTTRKSWWALSCCLFGRSATDHAIAFWGRANRIILGTKVKQTDQRLPEVHQGPRAR